MKNIFLILSGSILLFILAVGYDMYAKPQFTPIPTQEQKTENISLGNVPDFSFKTIDGKTTSIKELRGKLVIMNFWATWCGTCITEIPDMLNLVKYFEGDVVLLAISSDNKLEDITKFIAKQSDDIIKEIKSSSVYIVLDNNREITHGLFLTERYPETIIVSPDGEMLRKIIGKFDWASPEIQEYLKNLL